MSEIRLAQVLSIDVRQNPEESVEERLKKYRPRRQEEYEDALLALWLASAKRGARPSTGGGQ